MNSLRKKHARVKTQDFLDRIESAVNITSQFELVDMLQLTQGCVSCTLKRSEFVPESWILYAFENAEIMPSYIRTGKGPKLFDEFIKKHNKKNEAVQQQNK